MRFVCVGFAVVLLIAAGGFYMKPSGIVIDLSAGREAVKADDVAGLSVERAEKNNPVSEDRIGLGLRLRPFRDGGYADYNWLYEKNETPVFKASFAGKQSVNRINLSVWDCHGRIVYSRNFISGELAETEIRFTGLKYGTWMMTLDAYAGGSAYTLKSRLTRSFAVLPPVSSRTFSLWEKADDYLYGSCYFPRRYYFWDNYSGVYAKQRNGYLPPLTPDEVNEKAIMLARRVGMQVLRIDSFSGNLSRGWRDVWPEFEKTMALLKKHNVKMALKIAITPDVFVKDTLELDERQWDFWKKSFGYYLENVLNRKDHNVAFAEVGNEPAHKPFWGGTYEQYKFLYKYCYDEIKKVNPDVMVVAGGTCPPGADLAGKKVANPEKYEKHRAEQEAWYLKFYEEMGGLSPWFAYHMHGLLKRAYQVDWRTWERQQLDKFGHKAVRFLQTEGGSCCWHPGLEHKQWYQVMQKVFFSWASGDVGWIQFDLLFAPIPQRSHHMGGWTMLNSWTFAPRYQYSSWAAFTYLMAGAKFEKTVRMSGPVEDRDYIMQFSHPEGKMYVYFTTGSKSKQLSIEATGAAEVVFYDAMGNIVRKEKSLNAGGETDIVLNKEPRYVLMVSDKN